MATVTRGWKVTGFSKRNTSSLFDICHLPPRVPAPAERETGAALPGWAQLQGAAQPGPPGRRRRRTGRPQLCCREGDCLLAASHLPRRGSRGRAAVPRVGGTSLSSSAGVLLHPQKLGAAVLPTRCSGFRFFGLLWVCVSVPPPNNASRCSEMRVHGPDMKGEGFVFCFPPRRAKPLL